MDKEKEIAQEYMSSLVDLNVNSKPLINMLTILAEENIEHGQAIVNAVETHINKVTFTIFLISFTIKIYLFSISLFKLFYHFFDNLNNNANNIIVM